MSDKHEHSRLTVEDMYLAGTLKTFGTLLFWYFLCLVPYSFGV